MTSATPIGANTYQGWSNEALIARVTELEKQLSEKNRKGLAIQDASPASSISRPEPPKKKRKANGSRLFNPDKYNTRFIALKIAYLGHKYNGFEAHVGNTTPLPTIEEVLWHALVKTKLIFKNEDESLNWDGCEYSKCGRTDKGVSAFGQVVGIRLRSNRPKQDEAAKGLATSDENGMEEHNSEADQDFDDIQDELPYPHILNRVLPPDIRVLAWCPNPPSGFSARFSCRQRKYRYFFTQPAWCPSPTTSVPNGQSPGRLDIEAMRAAARKFVGLHDLRNFCKLDPSKQISNFERRIERAEIVALPDKQLGLPFVESQATSQDGHVEHMYSFDVSGSAFLWHQVRCMVGVLFLIGQGFETPELVDRLLDVQNLPGRPVYDKADDRPLVLWECMFPASGQDPTQDSLKWIYAGDQKPSKGRNASSNSYGEGRFGINGINEILWEQWQTKKIDEVLSGELLNIAQFTRSSSVSSIENGYRKPVARVFDGGGSLRNKGDYVPVMERHRLDPPDVLNARWRENNKSKAQRSSRAMLNDEADE
ncbi:MAG: hypothetical protein Q9162_002370 [Coniocarpon cinnabarinum]